MLQAAVAAPSVAEARPSGRCATSRSRSSAARSSASSAATAPARARCSRSSRGSPSRPTGRAEIHGRVGSLLEVGTGFHPELTGRENIYPQRRHPRACSRPRSTASSTRSSPSPRSSKFLDTPVKRYSSGMYVRLAFAVAAHLEPEILIVDEVLAVGDAAFQKKCLGKMDDVAQRGPHGALRQPQHAGDRALCRRAIWLDGGRLVGAGRRSTSSPSSSLRQEKSGRSGLPVSQAAAPGCAAVRRRRTHASGEGRRRSLHRPAELLHHRGRYESCTSDVGLRLRVSFVTPVRLVFFLDRRCLGRRVDADHAEARQHHFFYIGTCALPRPFLDYGKSCVTIRTDPQLVQSAASRRPRLQLASSSRSASTSVEGFPPGLLRQELPSIIDQAESNETIPRRRTRSRDRHQHGRDHNTAHDRTVRLSALRQPPHPR